MKRAKQRLELTWYNKDLALIPTAEGRYGYTWVSPADPRYCQTRPLVMDEYVSGTQTEKVAGRAYSERADREPQTDNLMVLGESGDVLEALTRIPELKNKYAGQVKCIYIDPPFNTGEMFPDYEDNLEHSVWLGMMRDRLMHMRRLLSDDGSIWVHLDEAESHRMRVLLDEIFGAGNFVAEVAWQKTYAPDNRAVFTQAQDSIMVYAKRSDGFKGARNLLPRSDSQNALYQDFDGDPRGPWKPGDFTAQYNPAENPREDQIYTLVTPAGNEFDPPAGRCWLYTQERYEELLADNRVYFGPNGQGRPAYKRFLSEVMQGRVPVSWWPYTEVGHNQDGKKEIKALIQGEPFGTPKPERLLERIIHIATEPGDIVLDVFAGSGTTAAVAHKMGRRWVACELVQDTFERFTRPRLELVVNGQDLGGVSVTKRRTSVGLLPEGLEPEAAADFQSSLTKVSDHLEQLEEGGIQVDLVKKLRALLRAEGKRDESKLSSEDRQGLDRALLRLSKTLDTKVDLLPEAKSRLRSATRTRMETLINWRGGGGFQVAHLAPPCFDYDSDLGIVTLTEAADDLETLAASVAATLKFRMTPDHRVFHAVQGRMRLFVTRTPLTPEFIREVASHLDVGEGLTIASTVVLDGAGQAAREAARGSRVIHIPHDLFLVDTEATR